ncbi:MAG: PQQ-binding-like beta-propeller repeat protein [Bacteriovoracia bacterium]
MIAGIVTLSGLLLFGFYKYQNYKKLKELVKNTRLTQTMPQIAFNEVRPNSGQLKNEFLAIHPILSTPTILSDQMIVGTLTGYIDSYDLKSGEVIWSFKKQAPVLSQAAMSKQCILIGEGLHETMISSLSCIRLSERKISWQREFLGHIESQPVVTTIKEEEIALITTGPSGLWAIKTKDGSVSWAADIGHVDSAPVVFENKIYVLAQKDLLEPKSNLVVLALSSGEVLKSVPIDGQPFGSIHILKDTNQIFVNTAHGQVTSPQKEDKGWIYVFSLKSLKLVWSRQIQDMILPNAVIEKDRVFFASKLGKVHAYALKDGGLLWTKQISKEIHASPALVSNKLALTTYNGKAVLLSLEDGKELESMDIGPNSTSSPIPYGNRIIFTSASQVLIYGK